jgi:hypothetical protein
MSAKGRPEREYRSAPREGAPASGTGWRRLAADGDNLSQSARTSPAQRCRLLV